MIIAWIVGQLIFSVVVLDPLRHNDQETLRLLVLCYWYLMTHATRTGSESEPKKRLLECPDYQQKNAVMTGENMLGCFSVVTR